MTSSKSHLDLLPAFAGASPSGETSKQKFERSLARVAGWIEAHDYKGYDPGDGLNSPLRRFTCGNRFAERILLQAVWKLPWNVRPLIGIKPMDSTKGRGYMAAGYLLRYKVSKNRAHKEKAISCLDWLVANKASGHTGFAWGNHFDFVTRSGCSVAGSPIIVWTSLIGHAFIDAYEQTGEERFLDVARGVCDWILGLPREHTPTGTCLSYVPSRQSSIHNSNMLGGGMLARTWRHTGEAILLDVAQSAMRYSCTRQRPDGSWWYGEETKHHWVDSFHTGYNLDSLKHYLDSSGDASFREHFIRGLRYFRDTFFESDGTPRYYLDKTYPIDIQCAAQAIETLSFCSDEDSSCREVARQVARWTIDNMQDRTGYFYYRQYPMLKARTPYIHWGQATMFKALAMLLSNMAG